MGAGLFLGHKSPPEAAAEMSKGHSGLKTSSCAGRVGIWLSLQGEGGKSALEPLHLVQEGSNLTFKGKTGEQQSAGGGKAAPRTGEQASCTLLVMKPL